MSSSSPTLLAMFALLSTACVGLSEEGAVREAKPAGEDDQTTPDGTTNETDTQDTQDTAITDSPSVEVPLVRILSPTTGSTVENPVTFTVIGENVDTIALDADGYSLGDAWAPEDSGSFLYTFNGTGYARTITLTGYDDGVAVATDSIVMTVADADDGLLDVPYFYQMDNSYEPSSTCGITSAAMLVGYWFPGQVTPDSLYASYGKSQGQSPSGLSALYASEGLHSTYSTSATRAQLKAHLDAGRPVVVHGYWTSSGHITVIVGYDAGGWYVNDPAGDWALGYFNTGGEEVYYPFGGGWDDAMGGDGGVWYSVGDVDVF